MFRNDPAFMALSSSIGLVGGDGLVRTAEVVMSVGPRAMMLARRDRCRFERGYGTEYPKAGADGMAYMMPHAQGNCLEITENLRTCLASQPSSANI